MAAARATLGARENGRLDFSDRNIDPDRHSPLWVVMRQFSGVENVYVFLGVAILTSALCFMLLKQDPRGVAGPGYLVIFFFGPLAIGWICWGLLSLIAWMFIDGTDSHRDDRGALS
jgi:hypothetical protein